MAAMSNGPGSAVPVRAMWVTAKPSGTSSSSGSSMRSSAHRHPTRGDRREVATSALKPHPDAPDSQLVAERERHRPIDAMAVDVGAVGAALVLDEPAPPAKREHRVIGADEVV